MNGLGSFGQYVPMNTPIHRIDARVKLLLAISLMVAVFLPYGNRAIINGQGPIYPYAMSLVVQAGILLLLLLGILLSHISFGSLIKSMSFLWFMALVIVLLNIFFWRPASWADAAQTLFTVGSKNITSATMFFVLYILVRIFLMVILSLMFAATTKPMEMTFALEWYLTPLRWVKVPTSAFSMTMSLALRFIPVLSTEAKTIFKAQAARGLDYSNGKFQERIKALLALLIPLITVSFHHAAELAYALEARGYDPLAKRTSYRKDSFRIVDSLWLVGALAIIAGSLFLLFFKVNGLPLDISPLGPIPVQ